MSDIQKHWDDIFIKKDGPELGWYEKDVSQTLKFLQNILTDNSTIFIPGAGTSSIVEQIISENRTLILNDISSEALNKLKSRLGERKNIHWLHHDISNPLPNNLPKVDVWIDRAVLHFLNEDKEIDIYFKNLTSSLKVGGYVLLAEFSTTGALKCAGLELHRYTVPEMQLRLGNAFSLIEAEEYVFINPFGDPRPYVYALFKKN